MDNDLKFNNNIDTDLYEKNVGNILDLEIEEEYDEIFFNVNVPESEKEIWIRRTNIKLFRYNVSIKL